MIRFLILISLLLNLLLVSLIIIRGGKAKLAIGKSEQQIQNGRVLSILKKSSQTRYKNDQRQVEDFARQIGANSDALEEIFRNRMHEFTFGFKHSDKGLEIRPDTQKILNLLPDEIAFIEKELNRFWEQFKEFEVKHAVELGDADGNNIRIQRPNNADFLNAITSLESQFERMLGPARGGMMRRSFSRFFSNRQGRVVGFRKSTDGILFQQFRSPYHRAPISEDEYRYVSSIRDLRYEFGHLFDFDSIEKNLIDE